ncbi:hypothetical protein [Longispora albida]|uniref:hypothetical protein n=1 Tax=Longispora albida TaxID=203523 RepID=UPI0003A5CB23|nr:hypothetical protein [Longispora albida]
MAAVELRVHGVAGRSPENILGRSHVRRVAGDGDAGFYRVSEPDDPFGPTGLTLEGYSWGQLTSGRTSRALWLLLLPFMLGNLVHWLRPGDAGERLSRLFSLSLTVSFVVGVGGMTLDLAGWQRGWLTAGIAVTVAVIVLLWHLGRRTWKAYESFPGDGGLWDGRVLVGRLRALHIAVAFATIVALLPSGVRWVAVGVLVAAGITVLTRLPDWVIEGLRAVAILLFVLYWFVRPTPSQHADPLPGYGATVSWLFAAQLALLLILFFRSSRVAAMVGSAGLGMSVVFSAGLGHPVAALLGGLERPAGYQWAGLGFVLFLVAAALTALAGYVMYRRLCRSASATTDADFPGGRAADPKRAGAVDTAIGGARLIRHVVPLLVAVYAPVLAAAVTFAALALTGTEPPGALRWAVVLGTWLTGLAVAALLALGVWAYTSTLTRRTIGVLWDIGTFWPRAAHPLAPPCYAERAVPELAARLRTLAEGEGVVLCGHSQGSVLAVGALLSTGPKARTALLSTGSPLMRIYGKCFPAYVTAARLAGLGIPWLNLWRETDGVSGPVSLDCDRRLLDPATLSSRIRGHGSYLSDPGYRAALGELGGMGGLT